MRRRSDRGTEYDFGLFNKKFKQHGIVHEKTTPYSLEMNGKAEIKNKTLTKVVVAIMLNSSDAPHWRGEILFIICYVLNRVPKSKSEISPYKILKKRHQTCLIYELGASCIMSEYWI